MSAVRPFRFEIPEAAITDLRRRLADARWPERETSGDWNQGAPLDYVREVCEYWRTAYDWRRCEARLNALPQFVTEIDGLDIQFIHVRSPHANALPMVMTGAILAMSRAIGEAAPILVLGVPLFIRSTPNNLVSDFTVLPLQIYNWAGRPQPEFHELAAAGIIVLLAVLLSFNAVAVLIRQRLQRLDA